MNEKHGMTNSQECFEHIIDTIRDPLIVLNQDLRVINANHAFYEFFKVTSNETVGHLFFELGDKHWDHPNLRQLFEITLKTKGYFKDCEVTNTFETIGRKVMLLNAKQIHRAIGDDRIVLLTLENITKQKAFQIGLDLDSVDMKALATELSRAKMAKTDFLSNLSEDIKVPLNAIIKFSEVLYAETYGPLNDKQKNDVYEISANSTQLLLMFDELLKLARSDSRKNPL